MLGFVKGIFVIFILLAALALFKSYKVRENFGLVYSNFEDMPPMPNAKPLGNAVEFGEPSQKPVLSDINDIDAQGILDAAQGIRNSVIPNAPFPPSVGEVSNMKPIDEKANYEDLRDKLRDLERQLPESVKEQIANLTPAIVNGMFQARDRQYAQ